MLGSWLGLNHDKWDRGQVCLRLEESNIWTLSCDFEGPVSARVREDNSPPSLLASSEISWLGLWWGVTPGLDTTRARGFVLM